MISRSDDLQRVEFRFTPEQLTGTQPLGTNSSAYAHLPTIWGGLATWSAASNPRNGQLMYSCRPQSEAPAQFWPVPSVSGIIVPPADLVGGSEFPSLTLSSLFANTTHLSSIPVSSVFFRWMVVGPLRDCCTTWVSS